MNGNEVGCFGDPCGCCGNSGRRREDDDTKGDFESVQDDLDDDDDSKLNTFWRSLSALRDGQGNLADGDKSDSFCHSVSESDVESVAD